MSRLSTSVRGASLMLAGACTLPVQAAAPVVVAKTNAAQKQLAKLAAAFHPARCKFDPLLFATANGDSRYNDQLGLAISPQVRAEQFALYRALQKQLMSVHRDQLGAQEQLTYDLLSYELNNALQLESFPEHLLPQHVVEEGGKYRIKGRDDAGRQKLLDDAAALEAAGAFACVLELITPPVAQEITRQCRTMLTVGIGSGADCDGQILVTHDLTGAFPWFTPKFVTPKAKTGEEVRRSVVEWMSSL